MYHYEQDLGESIQVRHQVVIGLLRRSENETTSHYRRES